MPSSPALHLRTLGELRLTGPAGHVLSGRRKELALLAYLGRSAPRSVPRDELAALLWGDRDEAKARQSLRHALLQLRRALPDAIDISNESARIIEGRMTLDASALEADVAAGRLGDAVERWQGDFLAGTEDSGDEPYRNWLERERESLRRTVVGAFARLVTVARDRNELEREVFYASRWAALFPLDSRAHARLVDARLRDGEVDAARAVYEAHIARLRSELDVDPSPELLQLGQDLERMRRQTDDRRPGSAALLTPDVVGRDPILASLGELWARVRASSAVVAIEGEEGIGKSRLCAEMIRRISRADRPPLVLETRGLAADRDSPWATAERLLSPLTKLPALEDVPNKALVELSAILPSLRQRFPHLTTPAEPGIRAAGALRDVLQALAARGLSVLLVVDDVALADTASRDLLLAIMRSLPPATMLLLTLRPDEMAASTLIAELARIPSARRIKLPPLPRNDVGRLLDSMLEIAPDDRGALVDRLVSESGGNPFYATELVSAMADAGVLTLKSSGRWQIDPALASRTVPLPPSLRAAVKTRLSQLSDPARRVLDGLAIQDARLDAERARQFCGLSSDAFEAAFGELLARRLLRPAPDARGGYEFSHEFLRRVAAERATANARDVEALDARKVAADAASQQAEARLVRRRRLSLGAVGLALLLAAAWGIARLRSPVASAAGGPPRMAVLDLELVAPDTSEAYLAAGLSEEITSSLSRFDRIRLKSRGAVRAARGAASGDPGALGRQLQVDYLVEGSLQRVGDRLKVAVRLTKADDGFQVWGHDFEAALSELPDLHERIATEVAERIGGRLSPGELSALRRPLTADAQAFEHYLRGNYFLGRRTPSAVEQAIDQYGLALARDSAFVAAEARIAYGYSLFVDWGWTFRGRNRDQLVRDGLALAQSALVRDSASADAWLARAYLLALQDPVSMSGSLEAFERAITLDPRSVEGHYQYGQTLMTLGKWDEARGAYRRAIALEPERAQTYVSLGSIERKLGRADVARRLYDSALVLEPGAAYARSARALMRLAEGNVRGALEDAEIAVRTSQGYAVPPHSMLAAALARSGDLVAARKEVARALSAMADSKTPSPTDARWIGSALIAVGRPDDALDLLERTRPRGAWLWFYCTASDFDSVRNDPRFVRIMNEAKPRTLGTP